MNRLMLPAVLVVEDEPLIRMDAVDISEGEGFRTFEADSADAALPLLEQNKDIGILFTDIDMPGEMDGLALARLVHERWPHIAILIASGVIGVTPQDMPQGAIFLPKPYSSHGVAKILHSIAGSLTPS